MNILFYGPQAPEKSRNGVHTANGRLARAARELGHNVTLGIPRGGIFANNMLLERALADTGCPAVFVDENNIDKAMRDYDAIFVSDTKADLRKMIRAAGAKRVFIMTHGLGNTQVLPWDAEYIRRPNARYLCVNRDHMKQAALRGVTGIPLDLPVPFGPRAARAAGNYCVAVGTDSRKRLDRVAEVAAALKMECRVYGAVPEKQIAGLRYMGHVPRGELLEALAGAAFLIHMSDSEGRAMAILEAIGLGTAAITPDTPLYDFLAEAPWCVRIRPGRDAAEELGIFDLAGPRKIANRKTLAKWAHEKYGEDAFKAQLAEILGVAE